MKILSINRVLEILGSSLTLLATFLISNNLGTYYMLLAFCIFLISNIVWFALGYRMNMPWMMFMNVVFIFLNFWGIWQWM